MTISVGSTTNLKNTEDEYEGLCDSTVCGSSAGQPSGNSGRSTGIQTVGCLVVMIPAAHYFKGEKSNKYSKCVLDNLGVKFPLRVLG